MEQNDGSALYTPENGPSLHLPYFPPLLVAQHVHEQHKSDEHIMILSTLRAPLRSTVPAVLRRGLATSSLINKTPLTRPTTLKWTQFPVRGVASSVSGRPGSQTLEHAATNIKEEVGNSTADLAKTIAGGNYYSDAVSPNKETFVCAVDTCRVWTRR